MSNIDRVEIIDRKLISDERGWFMKTLTGYEANLSPQVGEIYLTMGRAGQMKGGHYHPLAQEWFTIVAGNAIIRLEDVETHEQRDIPLSLNTAKTVFIPNMVAHSVFNPSNEDFILLAYTDRQYDPTDTIKWSFL